MVVVGADAWRTRQLQVQVKAMCGGGTEVPHFATLFFLFWVLRCSTRSASVFTDSKATMYTVENEADLEQVIVPGLRQLMFDKDGVLDSAQEATYSTRSF